MAVYTTLHLLILYIYQLSLHYCTTFTCSNQNCTNQDITCSSNTDCTINCMNENSCAFSKIYAQTTNTLTINCIGNSSCLSIHIYCPTSTNDTKKCFLKENDKSINIHIYAINGWKDIDIQHPTSLTQSPGSMSCGYNYASQCTIQNNWTCNNNQCSDSPDKENQTNSSDNFIVTYMIIIGAVVGLPLVGFCSYAIIKMCIHAVTRSESEMQSDNTRIHQNNCNAFQAVPPPSQIADTGKLQIPMDTQVDMTVTIDTTHKQAEVTDPSKKFSRYSSVVYTGSPLNNEPKSAVEVEIDTKHYMQQLSNAAEHIESGRNIEKNKPKKRFQNRKRFSANYNAKVKQLPKEDELTTPLTPERAGIAQQIEIDLDAYDLDEIDENKVKDSPYAQPARNSKLNMARTSSLRNLDKKDVDKFKALAVHHESLIQDVVMSDDIMTPNSPFTPPL